MHTHTLARTHAVKKQAVFSLPHSKAVENHERWVKINRCFHPRLQFFLVVRPRATTTLCSMTLWKNQEKGDTPLPSTKYLRIRSHFGEIL